MISYIGDYLTVNSIIQALQGLNHTCLQSVAERLDGDITTCGPLAYTTSNYVIELIKKAGAYFVRTKFEGVAVEVCRDADLSPDTGYLCPVQVWSQEVRKRIYTDWWKKCSKPDNTNDTQDALYGVVALLLGIFVLLTAAVCVSLAMFFKKSPLDEEIGEVESPTKAKHKDLLQSSSGEDFSMDPDARDHAFVRVKRG
jgi:hypothetical protein